MVRRAIYLLIMFGLVVQTRPLYAGPARLTVVDNLPIAGLRITPQADGIALSWQVSSSLDGAISAAAATTVLQQMPQVRLGGYMLPVQLTTVLLTDERAATVQIEGLAGQPWHESLSIAAPLSPPLLGSEAGYELLQPESPMLPTAPLFILREGRVRGQRVAVVAFSPLYGAIATPQLATQFEAFLPNAQPLTYPLLAVDATARWTKVGREMALDPTNAAALGQAVKVQVGQAGMQKLRGDALIEAGLAVGMILNQLHLSWLGQEISLEIRDADGLLDAGSEVRFYAQPAAHSLSVGDRWNTTETYWLTSAETNGSIMLDRDVAPGNAVRRDTAWETGIWESNKLYESTTPGIDGDHWFAASLRVGPGAADLPNDNNSLTIALNNALPLALDSTATSVFTLTGSARSIATHHLSVTTGETGADFTWTNTDYYADWQHNVTTLAHSQALNLFLHPGLRPSELRIDKIYWRQPAMLNFQFQGAIFTGEEGVWRYTLLNPPERGTLYDITDPLYPQIIVVAWGATVEFEDGPTPRRYLVAGPGTLHTPALSAHQAVTFRPDWGADALYIAPARFHDELAPLVEHRQRQGYRVMVIDVQAIYDAWSYGQTSPQAIRQFLRYAVGNWRPAPRSVVLVGDSTTDPHDYLGMHNPNIIPAYFANVDPWLGEVACENCFAQLDDDDPLAGQTDPGFLIDIWLGRFSVQNEAQLSVVVDKLLRYETVQSLDHQPPTSLYIADDFVHSNGTLDTAGDFAAAQDLIVVGNPANGIPPLQSPNLPATRLYYDPRPGGVSDPWREPDAVQARLRVIEAFQQGPSLVVYNGHSNQFQWASTVRSLDNPYLFGTNDIYVLHNLDRLPLVLEMTCLTAQFPLVSATGITIDERFQLHPDGGAVAVWGSAGLTVADGHDALMHGFQNEYWQSPLTATPLGALVEAGYFALFSQQSCCQETRKVFLLLGDPLTTALLSQQDQLFLPMVQR